MSEYQIVKFRAIDRPLTDKQLEFMSHQSSRADFNKWEFEVEYNFSSFGGDVHGMLRNGYDIYLTYSNYGCREICIRLPGGLPFPKSVWSKYIRSEELKWTSDKSGKAGILTLAPFFEQQFEDVWEFDEYLDSVAKLREMLIGGDLRALYILWLCGAMATDDDEEVVMEPPVPHGLGQVPSQATDLLTFYDLDPLLVDAAASGIPPFSDQGNRSDAVSSWVAALIDSRKTEIIQRLLKEDPVGLKSELLSEVDEVKEVVAWPVESPSRTVAQLIESSELLRQKEDEKEKKRAEAKAKREAAKAEVQRQERMTTMRSNPDPWLKKASKLVEERTIESYGEAASILADLREALGSERGDKIVLKHAKHLVQKNPNFRGLKSSLRKKALLD